MKEEKNLPLPEELLGGTKEQQNETLPGEEEVKEQARRALNSLTDMEEDEKSVRLSLRSVLGGDILAGGWFKRHFLMFVLITFLAIVYISNRYACQQALIEGKNLADTLLDRRYKALTRSSQLLEKTLRSHVEEELLDSTIQTSLTPSYSLKTSEEE